MNFVQNYNTDLISDGTFRKFEIIVWYNNGNRIDAQFSSKDEVFRFLNYIATA